MKIGILTLRLHNNYGGIQHLMPELDDDRGISAIIVNTEKGQNALHSTDAELYTAPYEDLCKKNPSLLKSCIIPEFREIFFSFPVRLSYQFGLL